MPPASRRWRNCFRIALLLDVMERCPAKGFPPVWVAALQKRLSGKDDAMRARVLALIHSRQIGALDSQIDRIIGDTKESDGIRLAAVGVAVAHRASVDDRGFQFLLDLLTASASSGHAPDGCQFLGRAKLGDRNCRSWPPSSFRAPIR